MIEKTGKEEYSLRLFYVSTLNHDCCYFRRDLFVKYGLYDESLKIVSDWKWFLQAIGLGTVKPVYVDIDVTIFDACGISETNLKLRNKERRQVLDAVLLSHIYNLTELDYAYIKAENDLKRHRI